MHDEDTPHTSEEMEKALRESEERYRAFITNTSEGIWRFEVEQPIETSLPEDEQVALFYERGYLAECNDAAARMYGYTRSEEIVGARLTDLLVRSDPNNEEYLRSFIRSGYRLADAESVEVDREGRRRYFLNNLTGVVQDGQLLRAWGTQRDITALKQTEENFKLYARVLDSMVEGVSLSDERGYIVYTNPAEDRMFGYERGELVGQHVGVQNAYPPEKNERIVGEVIAQLKEKGVWTGEWNNRRKDGTTFTTYARITAVEISGRPHWVCVQEDVTERRRAEEELRRSEEKYRSLLENANDIIYSHDLQGNYLTINRAGEKVTGYTREEILGGLNIAQVVAPEHLETARQMTQKKLHDPSPTVYQVDIISKDGRRLTLEVSTRIAYRDGQPVAVEGIARDVTDRKRWEEALTLSEQRLALAQEAGGIGTFDWDIRTDEVIWTPQLESLFGLQPGSYRGTFDHWRELVHPEDLARCETEIRAALRAKSREWATQYRMFRADTGEMRWTEARTRIFYNEAGEPLRMVGVNMDVTERVRAEAERERLLDSAREARDQAERALSQRRDVERRLRALVSASESLLGSPRMDVVHPAVLDLAHQLISADAYAVWRFSPQKALWEVVASSGLSEENLGGQVPVTSETPPLPQSLFVVEDVNAEPLLSNRLEMYRREGIRSMLTLPLRVHGDPVGALVFYYREPRRFAETDVIVASAIANLAASAIATAELYEEQRRLRGEAEAAERRASFLAEATSLLSSSLDYEKTLEAVARLAVPHVADWCVVDVIGEGQDVNSLAVAHVDPAKVEWARELQERYPYEANSQTGVPAVLRTGKSELYTEITDELLVTASKDAEHLRVLREVGFKSVMIVPLAEQGRTFGAITFVTAESGRRYGPEDLSFAEDLARRASLAVENARLYRQAREVNRLKDEFLATLSHELRTPLTAILGWASMLRTNGFDDATMRRALETIERNARAQKQIVEDVLDVSRIITGRLRLDLQPVEMRSLVQHSIETVRPAAEAKNVSLNANFVTDVGVVWGDPDRLQQVMWNLLSNAVKFTPTGGRVEVEVGSTEAHALIRVSDTGQGIKPDFLPHVFDRFRQADMGTTRAHGGLGLGLAIVRHLVELHGGSVKAESAGAGMGASFTVMLPLKGAAQAAPFAETTPPRRPVPSDGTHSPSLAGTRVLLVEDEEDAREMLKVLLENSGATVVAVGSAAEAWTALESLGCDILVSDIGMRGEDGYALVRRVRERDAQRGMRTPAVALTAYARDEDRTRALVAGFHAHLPKPVNPTELIAVVASLAALASGATDEPAER